MFSFLLFSETILKVILLKMSTWSYDGKTGPANWGESFPPAAGKEQSPIDIKCEDAEFDPQLNEKPLTFSYDENNFKFVENTGSSFNVTGSSDASSSKFRKTINDYHFIYI